jgi:hypothetical protein
VARTVYRKFTDKWLESITQQPAPGGHGVIAEFRDYTCNFLMLRQMASGTCTFYAVCNVKGEGRVTRLSIGKISTISLAAARLRAGEIAEALALGRIVETDISRARRESREAVEAERAMKEARAAAEAEHAHRKAISFNEIARQYFVHIRRRGLRSCNDIERDIGRVLVPAWGEREISSIKRSDMTAIITALADAGTPAAARSIYALTKALFGWAIERELGGLENSPCDHIKIDRLIGSRQEPRSRVLSDGEIRTLWAAATRLGNPYGDRVAPPPMLIALCAARSRAISRCSFR